MRAPASCRSSKANYLNYSVLAEDPLAGQHLGILVIELGVGITVAASMITIFMTFAGQTSAEEEGPKAGGPAPRRPDRSLEREI